MINEERRILDAIRTSDFGVEIMETPEYITDNKITWIDLIIAVSVGFIAGYFTLDIIDWIGFA